MNTRTVIGKRPTKITQAQVDRAQQSTSNGDQLIGPDWIICNAPRPIVGHVEWRGDFVSGVFYAAIDPYGERSDWMLSENEGMKADILRYVSMEQVRAAVTKFYAKEYPEVGDDYITEASDTEIVNSYFANDLDRGDECQR